MLNYTNMQTDFDKQINFDRHIVYLKERFYLNRIFIYNERLVSKNFNVYHIFLLFQSILKNPMDFLTGKNMLIFSIFWFFFSFLHLPRSLLFGYGRHQDFVGYLTYCDIARFKFSLAHYNLSFDLYTTFLIDRYICTMGFKSHYFLVQAYEELMINLLYNPNLFTKVPFEHIKYISSFEFEDFDDDELDDDEDYILEEEEGFDDELYDELYDDESDDIEKINIVAVLNNIDTEVVDAMRDDKSILDYSDLYYGLTGCACDEMCLTEIDASSNGIFDFIDLLKIIDPVDPNVIKDFSEEENILIPFEFITVRESKNKVLWDSNINFNDKKDS